MAAGQAMCILVIIGLAKMKMRILFEEMLPRISSVALDGEPKSVESWFVSGLKTLPIRVE